MAFGIYIHIPYCIQRCSYCDFATYEQSQIMPPSSYVELLKKEIRQVHQFFPTKKIETIYFGGGTPSLIPAEYILSIITELTSVGCKLDQNTEITIEINPATLDPKKMEIYFKSGVNRFSVGAQTFNDSHLKFVRREHSSKQTIETLNFLKSYRVNYSFDLLFALPNQTLTELNSDLDIVAEFKPNHISPYCLTVPEGHVLSKNRPTEDHQIEMFNLISKKLIAIGYDQYEISNYCLPGFESKHNKLYWDDENYWGLGLGAHSYYKNNNNQVNWGTRFWNPNSITKYEEIILKNESKAEIKNLSSRLDADLFEELEFHQSLTDFFHISLRKKEGFQKKQLVQKFGHQTLLKTEGLLAHLVEDGLLTFSQIRARNNEDLTIEPNSSWSLTETGRLLSNQVFSRLTFLKNEIPSP